MPMKCFALCLTLVLSMFAILAGPGSSHAEYPKPSIYPKSWQLDFTHGLPQRIVVSVPGQNIPQAYWYITYTVTNNTDQERTFLPVFEMLTENGDIIRSDTNIPQRVFDAIKEREKSRFMEPAAKIAGTIRIGEDQARDGVAIWPEPTPEMGRFSVFVTGLSGETTTIKGAADKNVILRKVIQLNYLIRGDEVFPGEDEVNENPEMWIMR